MTLNQVIKRIRTICLAHKQVRSFYRGFKQDYLTDQTRKFPAVFLEESGGSINIGGKAATFNYRLSFFDLVNVSSDTKTNEGDVDSDMVSVALDIFAQMNYGAWDDWRISIENTLELVLSEQDGDMYGGCIVDFSISVQYNQNICAIPSDVFQEANEEDLQVIFDLSYTGAGTEGSTIADARLAGKKILFIKRGNTPIYKVSNSPAVNEFTWNGNSILLGSPVNTDEIFLILYSGDL
jgi:hypothetical protein